MTDQVKDAVRRAARASPIFRPLTLYMQVKDGVSGRPVARTYAFTEEVYGTLRWLDYDQIARVYGGEVGDGIAGLIAPASGVPDLVQTAEGEWLAVAGAEGMDALGVTLKVRVRKWSGTPPVIQNAAP